MGNLFQLMGGTDTVKKLSSNLLQSAANDRCLAGVRVKVDTGTMAPSSRTRRGRCNNFNSALNTVTNNPLVKEGVSKGIAPRLGGIVGALI